MENVPSTAAEHINQLGGYFLLCSSYDALSTLIHTYFENSPDLRHLLPECEQIIEAHSDLTASVSTTIQPLPGHPIYTDMLGETDDNHPISIESRQIATLHAEILNLIQTHLS